MRSNDTSPAMSGRTFLGLAALAVAAPGLIAKRAAARRDHVSPGADHEALSDREYQVMCMIASGKSIKEIAKELYLNTRTIRTHRARILEKMKMKSNAELIHYAVKNQLVD